MDFLKNQYLVIKGIADFKEYNDTDTVKFNDFTIIHSKKLNCSFCTSKVSSVLLLGYILDPLNPDYSNNDIIDSLANSSKTLDEFIKNTQKYSGRFVLIYSNKTESVMFSDAFGLRQIYFNQFEGSVIFSSAPKLILEYRNWKPNLSEAASALINSDNFKKRESAWLGEGWYDNRIKKVLPNHYLDLNKMEIYRAPFFLPKISDTEIVSYSKKILTGSFIALSKRFDKIIQAVTAGWDSRLLLAASKVLKDRITYFVFINNFSQIKEKDAVIANKLASKLGIDFHTIFPGKLKKDFLDKYNKICFYPRILPKTANIQWHYYDNMGKNTININGNGGEILRQVYYYFENKNSVNVQTFLTTLDYPEYFRDTLTYWYKSALPFAQKYNLSILDLFYWEQRIGNWHALYQYEQDIAIEEFTPFNNKDFILAIMQIDSKKREKMNCFICKELMKELWSETLEVPINPILGLSLRKRIGNFIKKSSFIYGFWRKIINNKLSLNKWSRHFE